MTSDITRSIGAVTREVSSRAHDGRQARVVVASRTYDTAVEDVWDAITNAERIPKVVPADIRGTPTGRSLSTSR